MPICEFEVYKNKVGRHIATNIKVIKRDVLRGIENIVFELKQEVPLKKALSEGMNKTKKQIQAYLYNEGYKGDISEYRIKEV